MFEELATMLQVLTTWVIFTYFFEAWSYSTVWKLCTDSLIDLSLNRFIDRHSKISKMLQIWQPCLMQWLLKWFFCTFLKPDLTYRRENYALNHHLTYLWRGSQKIFQASLKIWRSVNPVTSYDYFSDIYEYFSSRISRIGMYE